ncbi:MAG: Haloacid dehalogenase domain protein hydrolase [Actinoallomurus sp.]|nr:Haloacid dehalogenase domain protein hydrolase [Actinoallomurus sp.]
MIAIGFDLDMTLADTREGIAAAFDRLSAETGVPIDSAAVVSRLGPPLETELAHWFPAEDVPAVAARYREFYGEVAVPATVPMPGAAAAVDAVRARGGRVVVVTAKNQRDAEATVRFLGLNVDHVVGALYGAAKGRAIGEHRATVYTGDHVADVDAARAAGARSVGVATGPFDSEALLAYGADIVLPDLRVFPETLTELINPGSASRQ